MTTGMWKLYSNYNCSLVYNSLCISNVAIILEPQAYKRIRIKTDFKSLNCLRSLYHERIMSKNNISIGKA